MTSLLSAPLSQLAPRDPCIERRLERGACGLGDPLAESFQQLGVIGLLEEHSGNELRKE